MSESKCIKTYDAIKLPSLLLYKLPNTHTYCTCPHVQSLGWIHLQNSTAICVCWKWSNLGFRLWLSLISFINVNIDAFVPVVNYLSNYIETSRYICSSSMPAIAISITPVAIWAPRPHGHILKIFGPWRRSRRLYGNPAVRDWFTRGEMLGKRKIAPKGVTADSDMCHFRWSVQNASILTHMKLSLRQV